LTLFQSGIIRVVITTLGYPLRARVIRIRAI
jgi:hypothetical protein